MAMLPFCGYNIGDYFAHWIRVGSRLKNPPLIFGVNWFRKQNEKCYGQDLGKTFACSSGSWKEYEKARSPRRDDATRNAIGNATLTPLGWVPPYQSMDWTGLAVDRSRFDELMRIDPRNWEEELQARKNFLKARVAHASRVLQIQDNLKQELQDYKTPVSDRAA